jgi:hypothetical protein
MLKRWLKNINWNKIIEWILNSAFIVPAIGALILLLIIGSCTIEVRGNVTSTNNSTESGYYKLTLPRGVVYISKSSGTFEENKYTAEQILKCIYDADFKGFIDDYGDKSNNQSILMSCNVIRNSTFVFDNKLLIEKLNKDK